MNLKRGTITVVFVLPGMLLLLVMTWLMGGGRGRGAQERLQIINHEVVGPPPPHLHTQVVSHTPEDHRMKLQSSHSEEVELRLSQSDDIDVRGEFQRKQIAKYCRKYSMNGMLFTLPENETERNLLNRHLIFDDKRKSLFCFVEKIGCTDMKRLMFVTVGVLPLKTIHDEWVDLKYLEKGLKRASFINKTLTDESRLLRIQNYFKFMIVRNPLERLVSGYRNKVMPPLTDLSLKFPNYIKRNILEKYRPVDFQHWLDAGGHFNITITFPEFVQYFIEMKKKNLNPHFKPMIHTCHPCRVQYDFYGNFKRYGQDAKLVISKLNMRTEDYPNHSLHPSGKETRTYLEHFYRQLSERQKSGLFHTLRSELEFYYHLYPEDKDSHTQLLGIKEQER